MRLNEIPRLLRTIRHLKLSQLMWRPRYMIERQLRPRPLPSPPREFKSGNVVISGPDEFPHVPLFHRPGTSSLEAVDMLDRGEFRHLNCTMCIGRDRPEWKLGKATEHRLWINTLHYHHWAYELARAAGQENGHPERAQDLFNHYLADWIENCGLQESGARNLAWNSFVIATRLSWWIRAWLEIKANRKTISPGLEKMMLESLWLQASYLEDHIEWDLRANHVMRDAVGLAWAGRFFQGKKAQRWSRIAAEIAVNQAEEQVLADGGHFERSPMYHVQIMEDVCSLAILLEDQEAKAVLSNTWKKMAEFLEWMIHPDGDMPLFNDGALNAVCDPQDMLSFGSSIGIKMRNDKKTGGRLFKETGMVAWHGDPWTVFFDVGPVGPDYQPGHAHADTLSVECSCRGKRLFVDPGTYSYDNDGRRAYDRSTDAHNTVCIDGESSSEVWHIFRVGRRARPLDVRADFSESSLFASASHDGYDYLKGRPRHSRSIVIDRGGVLRITDRIEGSGLHELSGGLLLAPEWRANQTSGGWDLMCDNGQVQVAVHGPAQISLLSEPRPYHPQYGLEHQITRLAWRIKTELPAEITATVTKT